MTLSDLAAELEISRPTLNKYRDEGCPIDNITTAREWIASRRASDGRGGKRKGAITPGGSFLALREQLQRADLRYKEASAKLREFEAEVARKSLVSMDEAKAYVAEILAPLRVLLDAMPAAVAPRANVLDPAAAEHAIREALGGLYRAMEKVRDGAAPDVG